MHGTELESPLRGPCFNRLDLMNAGSDFTGSITGPDDVDGHYLLAQDPHSGSSSDQDDIKQIKATTPAAAGDNSPSVISMVKKNGEDNSSVASSSECVASSSPLNRNFDGIRRISQQNTSQPPSGASGIEASILERFAPYALAEISGTQLRWRPDPSKRRHLAVWKVKDGWAFDAASRRVELVLGKTIVLNGAGKRIYSCLIESDANPKDAIERFTSQIGCLSWVDHVAAVPNTSKLVDGIDDCVVAVETLEAFTRTRGAALDNITARMLWDDDPRVCVRRIANYLAALKKRCPSAIEVIEQVRVFRFDELWDSPAWKHLAESQTRRFAATWNEKMAAKSSVFPGCFTTLLKIRIPETELLRWSRQQLRLGEVEAILNKITRNIILNDQPNAIARKYWVTAWERHEKALGRKMNADKIAKITDLLVRFGFLTKRRGFKKASLYGLGPQNPFVKPHLILAAPTVRESTMPMSDAATPFQSDEGQPC